MAYPGHPPAWGRLPSAPDISPSANSKRALQYLQKQLEMCTKDHEQCKNDRPVLPTRVLDVGSLGTEREVKLLEPPSGTMGKYVALSYCWGDGNALKATLSNLSELLQGVDEDELPATIRDAVELARYIGVQYLWVDALCIVQDDTQDWVHESARMSAVYAQAFLTISASSVASSRTSFLHQSRGNKEVLFHCQSTESVTSVQDCENAADTSPVRGGVLAVRRTTLSGFHQDGDDDIIDPTMTRAWTLQEHTLSNRLVSFSTDEIQWTCRTLRACECENPEQNESPRMEQLQRDLRLADPEGELASEVIQRFDLGKQVLTTTLYRFWTELVEAYCRRDLSCMRDKLPALSGVAKDFFQTFNEARLAYLKEVPPLRYLAGLWNFDLHRMLLWSVLDRHPRQARCAEYRAPSWSWASVEGRVQTVPKNHYLQPKAEVLAAVCTPANSGDPFGQVVREGTYLRLRATVLETQMCLERPAPSWGPEYMTAYGRVLVDDDLEEVSVDEAVWAGSRTVAAAAVDDNNAAISGPVQTRTLQRLRREPERSWHAAEEKRYKHLLSDSESESGSDDEQDNDTYFRHKWEESNLGRKFTVWLLQVADENFLVLGRPAGHEQVYERLGCLQFQNNKGKWEEAVSGQAKSIVTIV